jgi:hypothetical protein
VDLLEHINTSAAQELLKGIAGGGYGHVPAEAAQTSLKFMQL